MGYTSDTDTLASLRSFYSRGFLKFRVDFYSIDLCTLGFLNYISEAGIPSYLAVLKSCVHKISSNFIIKVIYTN